MGKDEKVLKRIKNLLDMAGDSSSPNEAMIAAKRARALMDKHQVTKEDLLSIGDSSFGVASASRTYCNTPSWVNIIAGAIGYMNDCQTVKIRGFKVVSFEFRGFKSDAVIAKYMHDYLIDTCSRLLKRSKISGKSERNFYRLGFARRINERIQEIVFERHSGTMRSDGKDLIVLKNEMVDSHFEKLKDSKPPNIRRPNINEVEALTKGSKDAENISFSNQVECNENLRLSI